MPIGDVLFPRVGLETIPVNEILGQLHLRAE